MHCSEMNSVEYFIVKLSQNELSAQISPKKQYVKGSNFQTTNQNVNIPLQYTHFI